MTSFKLGPTTLRDGRKAYIQRIHEGDQRQLGYMLVAIDIPGVGMVPDRYFLNGTKNVWHTEDSYDDLMPNDDSNNDRVEPISVTVTRDQVIKAWDKHVAYKSPTSSDESLLISAFLEELGLGLPKAGA
jgi:hypothetical protein